MGGGGAAAQFILHRLGKGLERTQNPIYAPHDGRRSLSGAGFEPMNI